MVLFHLWDHSAFVLKQVLEHVSRRGEGALPYFAYTGQVCAAEHNVLKIKQGVEFYYFNSKILIIYFIILIVNSILYYFYYLFYYCDSKILF